MDTKKVLIISSQQSVVDILSQAFISMTFNVIEAKDARQASFKFDNERFDLIVLDENSTAALTEKFIRDLRFTTKYRYNKDSSILLVCDKPDLLPTTLTQLDNFAPLPKPFSIDHVKDSVDSLFSVVDSKKNSGKKITLNQGDLLINEGDNECVMYLVKSGELEIFKTKDDKKIHLGTIRSGEIVGEMSFLDQRPRSASVMAVEHSVIYEINSEKFNKIINQKPKWVKVFIETLCQRLRSTDEKLIV